MFLIARGGSVQRRTFQFLFSFAYMQKRSSAKSGRSSELYFSPFESERELAIATHRQSTGAQNDKLYQGNNVCRAAEQSG